MTRPIWFRVAAVLLLLWGVMGCYACWQQFRLGAEAMGPATDYDRALYAALPVWYNAVYAVAVVAGFLTALALLAQTVLAVPLATISLAAVAIQFGWLFATTDIIAHKGAWVAGFPLLILAIAAFALWLARHARRRRWVR